MNPEKAKKLIFAFFLLAGYAVFVMYTGAGIPCLFRYFFHIQCPGCGITRMLLSLARGDFLAAFHYHPAAFVAGPFLLWLLARSIKAYLTDSDICWRGWERAGMYAVLVLLLVFTVVRNMPYVKMHVLYVL